MPVLGYHHGRQLDVRRLVHVDSHHSGKIPMTEKPELTERQKKFLHKLMARMREKPRHIHVPGQKVKCIDGTEYQVDAKGTVHKISAKPKMKRAERKKANAEWNKKAEKPVEQHDVPLSSADDGLAHAKDG